MSRKNKAPWHVLDFFCDDESSCALTIFYKGTRLHLIADAGKLDQDTEVGAEYHNLVQDYQSPGSKDDNASADHTSDATPDSGVDVTNEQTDNPEYVCNDAESNLQTWMVAPLADNLDELISTLTTERHTLQQWYHCPTRFCELIVSEDGTELEAIQLDTTPDLERRMEKLLPAMTLPKYISEKINIPYYRASDLTVVDESDQPPGTPFHPCRVQHHKNKTIHFLKIVDNNQPRAVKRELDVLRQIMKLRLQDQINVPILTGLVYFDQASTTKSGKNQIMGFLQTDIPEPTPLTMMLDATVPQRKRLRWAKEAKRMKDLLHRHDIVWADAKADNLVVDKDEKLWIIDFGGSYTEGWVDENLCETKEGDDMGTNKIVNALKDPVENTQGGGVASKRNRSLSDTGDDEKSASPRSRKFAKTIRRSKKAG